MSKAILHDQLLAHGGAERVAYAMARALDAPIYAMWAEDTPDDIEVIELSGRIGEHIPKTHYLLEDAYQMIQWQHVPELYEKDVIIQNKTNTHWFMPHSDSQTVVRYCHSTPRQLYDQFKRRGGNTLGDIAKTVQRVLYRQTTEYADLWLCNSEIVQRRLDMYWGEEAEVVYPPVAVQKAEPDKPTDNFLFTVGRLALNKRIDLLRAIAERTDETIVVAGDGPQKDTLLQDKPENLKYLGYVDEETKWDYLSRAKATLYLPENEDFGIVPIESFASGTPVIGVEEGYTKYQIKDGRNGYTIYPNATDALHAIDTLDDVGVSWSPDELNQFAQQFSTERFTTQIQDAVDVAANRARIQTNHSKPIELPQHD
jgi:glycosyltransferase involved in cell wall biosynthesis